MLSESDVVAALEQRWPESQIDPSLARITALLDLLGDPQTAYPVIQVTGTNGKTSTARMIEALLRAHGLRTGLFTSPHLTTVRERIVFDGEPIDEARFIATYVDIAPYVDLVDTNAVAAGDVPMTYFEVLTGMFFAACADAPVDVAIVEVGMGGSWDATNVADAAVAVITPIGLDHMEFLGDNVRDIALEKSGIIKADASAVIAPQVPEVLEVLLERCREVQASPVVAGVDFGLVSRNLAVGGQVIEVQGLRGVVNDVFLPVFGPHQAGNATLALVAVEEFLGQDALDADLVRDGFALVSSPGRLEIVRRSPTVIVDAAHNPHGAAALAEALNDSFDFGAVIALVAMFADKDARGFLETLEPAVDAVVVSTNSSPRSLDADALAAIAVDVFGTDRVLVEPQLAHALEAAITLADETDASSAGIVVTGSVVTVADVRKLVGRA